MISTKTNDIVCTDLIAGDIIANGTTFGKGTENFVEDANWIDNKTRGIPN